MLKMSRIIYKKRRFTTIIGVNNNLPLDPNFAALLANHHVQCACPNSEDFSDKENISVPDSLNTEKSTKTLE